MAILQFPLMPLGLSLFWSPDVSYGAEKFFNLLLSVNIAVIALASAMQQWGWRAVCQSLLIFLSALLLGALGYKLQFGFLDRYVPFLMFGPITFARLMGIGLVISLFLVRGVSRLLLVGLFGLAVIWTTSKGPILSALVVVLMWIIFDAKRPAENFSRLLGFAAITAAAVFLILQSGLDITKLGRLGALLTVSGEDVIRQGSTDSISIRYWLGIYSLQLIADQPMGVGLGGWATSVAQNFSLIYPHNLMLELWSEGGLLAGSFALLGFCGFLFAPSSIWKYVALFLLLAQMFSGDLLDGRYLLIFGLLSFFHTDSGLKRVRRVPEVIDS
jgi:hypothetical protein